MTPEQYQDIVDRETARLAFVKAQRTHEAYLSWIRTVFGCYRRSLKTPLGGAYRSEYLVSCLVLRRELRRHSVV